MKAAFKKYISQRYPVVQTRAVSVRQSFDVFSLLVFMASCLGLLATYTVPKIVSTVPKDFKPQINIQLPQPENTGIVSLNKVDNTPATVVMAGDSLARGKGSSKTNGILANIGYYLVNRANKIEPGISQYQVINGLSVDGSPVEDMNTRLSAQSDKLTHIPNLVLVMSFTNADIVNFTLDAKNAQSSNRIIEFFKVLGILHDDSASYQRSLATLRVTLADLHAKRVKLLGTKKAAMQAVILGVPNVAYSPSVMATLHKYQLTYDELDYVINTYNADDKKAVVLGNKEQNGVTYSFINLDRLHVPEKTALSYLSSDNFHPNSRGYKALADFVAQNVVIRSSNQSVYLANQ